MHYFKVNYYAKVRTIYVRQIIPSLNLLFFLDSLIEEMKIKISNFEMGKGSGGVGDKCKLKSGEEFVKKEYFEFDIFPGYSFRLYQKTVLNHIVSL